MLTRREGSLVQGGRTWCTNMNYVATKSQKQIEGAHCRLIDIASGRFAIIEKTEEFSPAP